MTGLLFSHTASERGLWRGWLRDGQTFEISCRRRGPSFGGGVRIHSGENASHRSLYLALGWVQIYIPIGIIKSDYRFGDEPNWSLEFSHEMGIVLYWGRTYKSWRWPFHTINLDHSYRVRGDRWRSVPDYSVDNMPAATTPVNPFWNRPGAAFTTHDYTYKLENGTVQRRKATILEERWTRGRNILSRLGWPSRVHRVINVHFDDEVGERTGSWKGGTIGCGYNMLPDEKPLDTLRRMERERKF